MSWLFPLGVIGTIAAMLCCAGILTPLLISVLVAVGLGALTVNVDLIVFLALLIFPTMAILGSRGRRTRTSRPQEQAHERLLHARDEPDCVRRPGRQYASLLPALAPAVDSGRGEPAAQGPVTKGRNLDDRVYADGGCLHRQRLRLRSGALLLHRPLLPACCRGVVPSRNGPYRGPLADDRWAHLCRRLRALVGA